MKRSWGLETEVAALAWSGDGRLAVAAGAGVTIWDGNRAAAHLKGGDSFIRRMTWSPDGTRVAAGFAQGIVRVWDVGTGHEVFQTNVGPRWEPIDGLTWLDSEHLAVCNSRDDGRIHVLDLRDREPEAVLKTGAGWLPALAWHPSGNLAAACWTHTGEPQVTIRLWERNVDGSFPAEPAANWQASANVLPLAWSPDGRFLVGAGSDGSIEIWQTALRTRERLLDAHKGPVRDVAWAPDGSRLASVGDDGTLRIWEPLSGRLLATLTAAGDTTLAQTPGGYCVIEGDATRVRWALPHPEHPLSSLYVPLGGYRAVVVNPERVRTALAGDLSNDDLNAELESRGWLRGLAWNGQRHLAPRRSPSDGAVDATDRPSARAATSVEAMKPLSVENPFLPGGPLRDDPNPPGRDADLRKIQALVEQCSLVALLGPRRAGKTSVLNALRLRLRQSYRVRHTSLEMRQPRTADALADTLGSDQAGRGGPADSLYKALTREKKKRAKTVLLFDEVGYLANADLPLFSWLRNRPGGIGGDRLRRHVTRLDQGCRGGEPQSGLLVRQRRDSGDPRSDQPRRRPHIPDENRPA